MDALNTAQECLLSNKNTSKFILHKSRGKVSLIDCVPTAYSLF